MAVISKELGQLSGCWVLEMDMIGLAMEKLIFMKFSMGNHPFIWPYILPIIGELTLRNHQTIHLILMQISPRLILEICLYYACILNQSLFFALQNPLISGLEWNIQDGIGQIDLTWWFKWFDLGSQTWVSRHTTKSLFKHGGYDYYDFLNSFNGEGFSLLINLAEGGDFPGTQDVLVDGKKQYLIVKSAKAYGF